MDEAIEPPPADQVSEVPATPPCDLTGSSSDPVEDPSICSSGSLDPPATPDLPAPRVVGRSAMQFRPVLSVLPGSCQGSKEPPPDQPAQLPGSDGCYDLGPSGLTVTKADMKAESDVSGMLYVAFTLDEADAVAFDRLAEDNVGKQVAIVIFGRVVSAPTIQQSGFNGRGQISGVDPQTAADIISAVGG
ncbi:MAG: SecDF P1 head subdomain-containing protein [Acidimicrobiales bacterium]